MKNKGTQSSKTIEKVIETQNWLLYVNSNRLKNRKRIYVTNTRSEKGDIVNGHS